MQPQDERTKPVTPQEQRAIGIVVQLVFILAFVTVIFIDASSKEYSLPLIVYAILGAGSIGTENFIKLWDKVRGKP